MNMTFTNSDRLLMTLGLGLVAVGMVGILALALVDSAPTLKPAIYSDDARTSLYCRVEMINQPTEYKAWRHCK